MIDSDIACPGCNRIEEAVAQPRLNIGIEDVAHYLRALLASQNPIEQLELRQIRNILETHGFQDDFDNEAEYFELPTLSLAMRIDRRGVLLAKIEEVHAEMEQEIEIDDDDLMQEESQSSEETETSSSDGYEDDVDMD